MVLESGLCERTQGRGNRTAFKYGSELPTLHSTMHLYPVNGAAHRPESSDTPWSYRRATWSEVIVGVDPDPTNRDRITTWAKSIGRIFIPIERAAHTSTS